AGVSARNGATAQTRRGHAYARDRGWYRARDGGARARRCRTPPGAIRAMNKSYRQGQILKLIRAAKIFTQDDLARELKKTYGIRTTQVTLSRDIRELGLVKTQEGYRQVEAPTGPDFASVAGEFLWDVRAAQNLVLLKT